MAFKYHIVSGTALTTSQEDLLEKIENLPSPFTGILKMKDLRAKTGVKVLVADRNRLLQEWEGYHAEYKNLHDVFYSGERMLACHKHQGEIRDRRNFADEQIRCAKDPREGFLPLLGLYTRNYEWWSGAKAPKVVLITDNIRDYVRHAGIKEDIVFGLVFIQEMMHAYFDAFNSRGFPSILSLEESFAEFAMLTFIDESPDIRFMLPYAKDYVISRIGKNPGELGYGIELFIRSGEDAIKLINRYRDISNWTEPPFLYKNSYNDNMRKFHQDPSEENADKVYEDIIEILNKDWEQTFDPIQPAIGEPWDFDR